MFIFEWLSHIYHVYWIIVKCKYLSGRYDITNCHLFIIQHKLQSMSHPMYFVYLLKIVIKGLEGEFLWRTFWQFFGYPSWLSILVIKYYWNHTSEMLFKSILLHVKCMYVWWRATLGIFKKLLVVLILIIMDHRYWCKRNLNRSLIEENATWIL